MLVFPAPLRRRNSGSYAKRNHLMVPGENSLRRRRSLRPNLNHSLGGKMSLEELVKDLTEAFEEKRYCSGEVTGSYDDCLRDYIEDYCAEEELSEEETAEILEEAGFSVKSRARAVFSSMFGDPVGDLESLIESVKKK